MIEEIHRETGNEEESKPLNVVSDCGQTGVNSGVHKRSYL